MQIMKELINDQLNIFFSNLPLIFLWFWSYYTNKLFLQTEETIAINFCVYLDS